MTANGWFQILLFLAIIFLITKPLGIFMTRVFNREKTFLDPVLRPIEKLLYRVSGVDETHEMRWTEYAVSMLLFSGATMLILYFFERLQQFLRGLVKQIPQFRAAFIGGMSHSRTSTR